MLSFRPLDRSSAARFKEVIDAAIGPRVGQAPEMKTAGISRGTGLRFGLARTTTSARKRKSVLADV
jgi:hypothetical protein